jgi:hypothetical protein
MGVVAGFCSGGPDYRPGAYPGRLHYANGRNCRSDMPSSSPASIIDSSPLSQRLNASRNFGILLPCRRQSGFDNTFAEMFAFFRPLSGEMSSRTRLRFGQKHEMLY